MFQRLVNFWVQTFVTERLLASPTFHRIAAKTHQHVSSLTEKGSKHANEFSKAFKENLEKESKNYRK
ncbi:uncharacterized protein BX664DRAFT_330983 [Halteromyces radiatus]|uniref:uncharacterized protein n=1 Tax=Halteromyces radiatus TaxID=101107 RepID=UPI00221FA683|nr:uncharacterized protein BX664DRAFT_330983 [Halteromyces radiatus]KAI8088636.1 hypothetical protein BX664DRAFT_330983 [Halteromyces radiatus]